MGMDKKRHGNQNREWLMGKNDPSDQIVSENIQWLHRGKNDLHSYPKRGSIFPTTGFYKKNEFPTRIIMKKTQKFGRETLSKSQLHEQRENTL